MPVLFTAFLVLAGPAVAQPAPGGPPAVGVVRAERQQITQTDEFIGRIQAVGRVALVARVTAFLVKRLFVEGSEVKKDDLLYLLEQPPFQAQVDANKATVEQLEAQHRNAEQALERAQALLKTQAGTQSTLDSALAAERALAAQIAGARAQLRQSEINLGYTEIRAPIDGKISSTAVTEGNVVSPTTGTLATLVSQDPMYVIFSISQRTGIDLRDRYAARGGFSAVVIKLRLADGRIYGEDGKADYVSPTVAENTDTITVRGVIPNTKVGMLRQLTDGEFVTVLLEGVQPIFVLAIPRAAVLSDQQGDYVYVVDTQNKADIRRIQLGQSTPTTAVVTDGLKEGELVISEGLQRVRPGEAVSAGPASPPPGVSSEVARGGASGSLPEQPPPSRK
ncbi:MAG TPA: efflux RND transporter periplasmic adaptor subunit [Stellaceae bacterium]|nr:efflux RND transporter periplasmic adaptor subunit [Stellaceae bacterium]